MKNRFKATNNKALLCRFHVQTAGSSLQAQQIDNNVVRTALQGLSAVLGGTQSLHTNSKDEALSLPTEKAAKLALRTQQIIAYESGAADVVDPLAGSHYIENLTDEIEKKASELIEKIDDLGGAIPAIENHFQDNKISNSAFEYQKNIENKNQIIVGTNKYAENEDEQHETLKIDEDAIKKQLSRLKNFKQKRNIKTVENSLKILNENIKNQANLIESIINCIKANCTLGEITLAMKNHFGEYV